MSFGIVDSRRPPSRPLAGHGVVRRPVWGRLNGLALNKYFDSLIQTLRGALEQAVPEEDSGITPPDLIPAKGILEKALQSVTNRIGLKTVFDLDLSSQLEIISMDLGDHASSQLRQTLADFRDFLANAFYYYGMICLQIGEHYASQERYIPANDELELAERACRRALVILPRDQDALRLRAEIREVYDRIEQKVLVLDDMPAMRVEMERLGDEATDTERKLVEARQRVAELNGQLEELERLAAEKECSVAAARERIRIAALAMEENAVAAAEREVVSEKAAEVSAVVANGAAMPPAEALQDKLPPHLLAVRKLVAVFRMSPDQKAVNTAFHHLRTQAGLRNQILVIIGGAVSELIGNGKIYEALFLLYNWQTNPKIPAGCKVDNEFIRSALAPELKERLDSEITGVFVAFNSAECPSADQKKLWDVFVGLYRSGISLITDAMRNDLQGPPILSEAILLFKLAKKTEDLKQKQAIWKRMIQADPKAAAPRINLASLLCHEGEYAEACTVISDALAVAFFSWEQKIIAYTVSMQAYIRLAHQRKDKKRPRGEISDLQIAVENAKRCVELFEANREVAGPVEIEIVASVIRIYMFLASYYDGRFKAQKIGGDQAETHYTKALNVAGREVSFLIDIANELQDEDLLDRGERAARRALEIEPENTAALKTLAKICGAKKEHAEAAELDL